MNAINRLSTVMLRSPLLWGALFSVGFFAPIETGAKGGRKVVVPPLPIALPLASAIKASAFTAEVRP